MSDEAREAARRIVLMYPEMGTPNEYDTDAYTVARAYLDAATEIERLRAARERADILIEAARAALKENT